MKTILAAAVLALATFTAVGCAAPADGDDDAQEPAATQRVELGPARPLALASGSGASAVRVIGPCSPKAGTTNQYECSNRGWGPNYALFDGVGVSQSVTITNTGKVAFHVSRSGGRLNMTSYFAPGASVTMEGDERFGGTFILRTDEPEGAVQLTATIH